MRVSNGLELTSGSFFIQIATRRSEAELMAECPMCGAMNVPWAYAWHLRAVACCECGTKMAVGREVLSNLRPQAAGAVSEIARLM